VGAASPLCDALHNAANPGRSRAPTQLPRRIQVPDASKPRLADNRIISSRTDVHRIAYKQGNPRLGVGVVRAKWFDDTSDHSTNTESVSTKQRMEVDMGFGRGALLWLLGVPIPIIILLALFWHH
jgi:hypothetical protein